MVAFKVAVDLKTLRRDIERTQQKQIPFAQAQMATGLAKRVAEAETEQLKATFPSATPFTLKAFRIKGATKSNPTALVTAKDIQAAYLEPFVTGGMHYLGGKQAILAPRAIPLNQYGNIPRGKIASLKGKPGVFIGAVKTANGVINGVWQRQTQAQVNHRRRKVGLSKQDRPRGGLKLLVRFEDPQVVKQQLPYRERAAATIVRFARQEWDVAWAKAIATAR